MSKEITDQEIWDYALTLEYHGDNSFEGYSNGAIWMRDKLKQMCAEKDKEIETLRQPAAELLHLHLCEQEGVVSGQPTPKQWLKAVDELAKALNPQN